MALQFLERFLDGADVSMIFYEPFMWYLSAFQWFNMENNYGYNNDNNNKLVKLMMMNELLINGRLIIL